MNQFHKPVLLKEVLEFLNIKKGRKYIDATLGGGGHTREIVKRGGVVLGIDVDQDAITYVKKILRDKDIKILGEKIDRKLNISVSEYPNIILARGNFRDIDTIARLNDFKKVSGIIFDLGVSSFQIDTPERGFAYQKEGPLDMRMDKNLAVRAADLINVLTKGELNELFSKLGEERFARLFSERITLARRIKKIETTGDLIKALEGSRKFSPFERSGFMKRVFQALRIAVNDELNNLKEALPKAIDLLEGDGRLLVISFHSLEDRIVKVTFDSYGKKGFGIILTKNPITPSFEEISENRRSKSAKMRVFQKA